VRARTQRLPQRAYTAVLVAGDLLCFVLFALLGLRSHEDGITLDGLLRAALPFQAGWLLVSLVVGPKFAASQPVALLRMWAPAWLIGLLLRAIVFGRPLAPTFALVAFLANFVLLLLWRLATQRLLSAPSR
jgi:hypothetical protein